MSIGFMRRSPVSSLLLVPFLTACVHKYAVPDPAASQRTVPAAATVYVTTPTDGQDDRPRSYAGSGGWTAAAVADALRDRGATVTVGGPVAGPSKAVEAARAAGADLLAYSRILHWSDRLTEWSGVPDRITLQLTVYDVGSGAAINKQEIRASSRWLTFGGDHPQELLPELTRRWAETVMRERAPRKERPQSIR